MKASQKKRDVVFISGKTGMGKSLFTSSLIKEYKRVLIFDLMCDYNIIHYDDTDDLIDHIIKYKTFRVGVMDITSFPKLCEIAVTAENTCIVIEEAQRVLAPKKKVEEEVGDAIYRGRHSATSIILVSQRPSTVNVDVRSQWSRLIVFAQTEPKDIRWFAETTGMDIEDEILNLEPLEYLDIRPSGYTRGKLKLPKS